MSRPWTGPLGLYRPGRSAVHRAPVGLKLALLTLVGVAVVVLTGPVSALAVLAAVLLTASWARIPARATVRALTPILLLALGLGGYQWWQRGPAVAVEVTTDLFTLVLAATLVTATTSADRLLGALTSAAAPLRRLGVAPETVAITVTLMLRSIPTLLEIAAETRDAARARGLGRHPRALLVPMVLRTVARAHDTGRALTARGLGDEPDDTVRR